MHPYIEKLNARILAAQPEIDSLLDMLYQFYTEQHPIEDSRIRSMFGNLDAYFQHLSPQANNKVFGLICTLCCEHERLAFLEGIRVGVRLADELDI